MKTILITGGSGKVGFQLVNYFLGQGDHLITTTRNKELFLTSKKELLRDNWQKNLSIIEVDFSQDDSHVKIVSFLKDNSIEVDAIVHNARSLDFLKIEDDLTISEENFAGEFYMDVIFPYRLTMEINRLGKRLNNVIFISSMYGVVAPTPCLYENFQEVSPVNYGVCKAAQIHLTKELAVRMAPVTRVNCVSFGGIKGRTNEDFLGKYKSLTPQQKMLEEEDVTGPVDFLLSESSKNMTGQNLIIDGGWTIW